MEKFEINPDIKKLDATQLDINFEDVSKKLDGEKEKEIKDNNSEIDDVDNGEKEKPGYDYYEKYNEYEKGKIPLLPKKPKTQQEKDYDKRKAILKALEKRKNKGYTTGYEHPDPWNMSR